MKIFVVNYDLRHARNYDTLYRRLESLGGKRVLESMWTLKLSDTNTCAGLRDDLLEYMDSDDGMLVSVQAHGTNQIISHIDTRNKFLSSNSNLAATRS